MLAVVIALASGLGQVEETTSRWTERSDAIITEVRVRGADGVLATVVQLGGSVDGVGMLFTHVPAPARVGEMVRLEDGRAVAAYVGGAGGAAAYGVQRTTRSRRPLVRGSAALHFIYDAAGTVTVPERLEFAVLDDAFARWLLATQLCGELRFTRDVEADVPSAPDGRDSIHFRDDRWCRPTDGGKAETCYPTTAVAVTRVLFVDSPDDPADGTILETDIDINAVDYALLVAGAPLPAHGIPMDLMSAAIHEIGHALGLDHNCDSGSGHPPTDVDGEAVPACASADPSYADATMYFQLQPNDTRMRTLESTDVEGACALLAPRTHSVTGGCSTGRPVGVPIAMVLLMALRRRARRRGVPRG